MTETNSSTQVDESESEDTVFVSLGTAPTSQVNIIVNVADLTEVSVNHTTLSFGTEGLNILGCSENPLHEDLLHGDLRM